MKTCTSYIVYRKLRNELFLNCYIVLISEFLKNFTSLQSLVEIRKFTISEFLKNFTFLHRLAEIRKLTISEFLKNLSFIQGHPMIQKFLYRKVSARDAL